MYQVAQKAFSSILSPTSQWATLGETGAEVVPFLWYSSIKEKTERMAFGYCMQPRPIMLFEGRWPPHW